MGLQGAREIGRHPGSAVVEKARAARARVEDALSAGVGPRRLAEAKKVLLAALDLLGGLDEIRERRVREPRERRGR
jgi:hypothetical protein